MSTHAPEPGRRLTELWTFFAVNPLARPLSRRLARHRSVTPNRLTAVALMLGVAAAACFATGRLRTGGVLFVLRFFVDCLDGAVARLQASSSTRGAFFDLAADVIGVTAAYATLGWYLVDAGHMHVEWLLALLGALGVYNWELGYRKRLAAEARLGTGGATHRWSPSWGLLRHWVAFCDRHRVSAVPWAVESEIATLGLAPLVIPARTLPWAVFAALAFYVVADLLNARRIWRIAAQLDRPLAQPHRPARPKPRTSPTVDVIIATRNRPELLRRAIAGVLDQTAGCDITCYVVFDQCEPDESLAEDRPGRKVVVLGNTRSPGLAGARNTGVLVGGGTVVAFCDDDDVWLPEKLEMQLTALDAGQADTSVTGITVEYDGRSVDRVPTAEQLRLEYLVRHRVMAAHPSSVLVRRSALLLRIGLVDEKIPGSYGEDFDWLLRAAQGRIAVVSEPLVRVRWGGSQFSGQWQTIVDAIDYGLKKHAAFHRDPRALGRLYGRKAFALAAMGRPEARCQVLRTLRVAPLEPRAYLAAAVVLRLVTAEQLLHVAHRRGHGI